MIDTKTSKRRRRKTLPYGQRYRGRFRGWWLDNGRRRYTGRYPTEEGAHKEAVLRRKQQGRNGQVGRLDLQGAIDLVRHKTHAQGRRAGTLRYLEGNFSIILSCFSSGSPLDEFTTKHIERFIRKRQKDGVSANTIRHNLTVFSRIVNVAIQASYIDRNPVNNADRPQVEDTKIDVFKWNDLLECVIPSIRGAAYDDLRSDPKQDADIILLFAHTGLRRAEVARLTVSDFDGEQLHIFGKTGGRVLPVPPQLGELLNRMREGKGFVPGNTEAKRTEAIRRVFERWQKRLGEPRLHAHALRHTFASELARRNVPEHVIADLLGHKRRRSSITSRYVSALGREYVEAMACLWSATSA